MKFPALARCSGHSTSQIIKNLFDSNFIITDWFIFSLPLFDWFKIIRLPSQISISTLNQRLCLPHGSLTMTIGSFPVMKSSSILSVLFFYKSMVQFTPFFSSLAQLQLLISSLAWPPFKNVSHDFNEYNKFQQSLL